MIVVLSLLYVVTVCAAPTWAIEAMYDGFEQLNGTDIADFQLRAKKINRTMVVLDGVVNLKKPLHDGYKVSLSFFHSAKGNQQFNHYPMKIPPTNICEFTTNVWPEYVEYYNDFLDDNIKVGECPIEPREIRVNNHILNAKMLSEYAPEGLWKVYLTVTNEADEGFAAIWIMKLYPDGYLK